MGIFMRSLPNSVQCMCCEWQGNCGHQLLAMPYMPPPCVGLGNQQIQKLSAVSHSAPLAKLAKGHRGNVEEKKKKNNKAIK
mmetsp:Transcript_78285/g.91447  ORF Transcript_78285/g.91447 Transcript_78285/m.91447 type:complete len:81 (+) Transcript_78285:262-504(+)